MKHRFLHLKSAGSLSEAQRPSTVQPGIPTQNAAS